VIEEEDKVSLTRKRVELVESLATPLPPEEHVRVQGEISVINAKIKALNTMAAVRLKVTADRRKALGLAEAQANAARARARVNGTVAPEEDPGNEDDDPGQTEAIDGWIDAILLRHDVEFTRSRAGKLTIDVAPKWANVFGTLIEGVYAAARGQELPDLPSAAPKAPKAKPKKR